jgi:hypothetical protein
VFDVNSEEVDNKVEELSQAGVDVTFLSRYCSNFLGFGDACKHND